VTNVFVNWKVYLDVFQGKSEVPLRLVFKNNYQELVDIAGGVLVQNMRKHTLNIKNVGKLKVTDVQFKKDEEKALIVLAKRIEEEDVC
jgi:hypothetical protein